MRRVILALACATMLFGGAASAAAAPFPFGKLACVPQENVRWCEGQLATRVASFDSVPLDVNVALPKTGDENLPLVVMLPAWSQPKKPFADMRWWALRGYAVLSYTPRGFRGSCGSAEARLSAGEGCERGWIHVADVRREVRDTQHLIGLLVDEGLVSPSRIGAVGYSYGGGQSLMLATLRDRTVLEDGTIVPWTSPAGEPIRVAAASPSGTWSDLSQALMPDGSFLDYVVPPVRPEETRAGVLKQTFTDDLMAHARSYGLIAPYKADPTADLYAWEGSWAAGESYVGSAAERGMRELAKWHSAISLPLDREPAPVLFSSGWTDDLLPASEGVRYYNHVKTRFPGATVALIEVDHGHGRAQNKVGDYMLMRNRTEQWFEYYVKGRGIPPFTGVEALTQTCPKTEPSGGPHTAATWEALHPGEVRRSATMGGATFTSAGGNASIAKALDPYQGRGGCADIYSWDDPGAVTMHLPAAQGSGYTILGSPTVIADLAITGDHPQIAARLWDMEPDGSLKRLITRTLVRPTAGGRLVFQLHPAGWHVAPGHVVKLELLGADPPFARRSNGTFSIAVGNLDVRLPVAQTAGAAAGQVQAPAAPVVPAGLTPLP